jgi:TPR repeat protein
MKRFVIFVISLVSVFTYVQAQQTVNPNLLAAAERGDVNAQKYVSNGYKNGSYGFRKNPSQAFYWMNEAAQQDDAEALYEVAKFYRDGFGTKEDFNESLQFMKKAADRGLTEAQSEYGFWMFRNENYKEAIPYLQDAARKDNALATFYYGQALLVGLGIEQNVSKGVEYIQGLSDIMPEATEFLANMYSSGIGVQKDFKKAIKLFDQAIAQKPDDLNFVEHKGLAYLENGMYEKAKQIYEQLCAKIDAYPTLVERPLVAAMTNNVDYNIPKASISNKNTIALIISNEHYKRVSPVVFANNDGTTLRKYFNETLGIPETNIIYAEDASLADMKYNVEALKQRTNNMGRDCEVICYYAGHGIPDMTNKTAYLLPIDSYGTDTSTGYSLEEFYKTLSELNAKSVTVILDACFSGAKREGDMLVAARGVAIKVKDTKPKGNLIVLSAAQGDETAYPYNNQKHGLFTYYFLRKLQETGGNATLGEIADYVKSEVLQKSIEMNGKSQTPSVSVSSSMESVWKDKKLR